MTLNELKQGIDRYFNECEAAGVFPDEAGMALFLGIERGALEKWLVDERPYRAGFRRAIRDARLRRESVLVRGIYASDKSTTGKIFLSRQGFAGALSDKAEGGRSKDISVEIKISGMEDCFD
ncbi:MAG: hypothetical protein GX823_05890 [Clostridiales bacterium]|nr:hypothetical protein [Clostridiales bacterium]